MKPLGPQELREATVRDLRRATERMGAPVDMRAIEAEAVDMCNVFDAHQREFVEGPPAAPNPELEARRARALDDTAAAAGAEIIREQRVTKRHVPRVHARPKPFSRWSFALGRMKRILEGAAPSKEPWSTCTIPALAKEMFRLHAFVATRFVPPRLRDEPNPFYGLTDEDFANKFQRLVEDICDKSTGKLGPWWVPK